MKWVGNQMVHAQPSHVLKMLVSVRLNSLEHLVWILLICAVILKLFINLLSTKKLIRSGWVMHFFSALLLLIRNKCFIWDTPSSNPVYFRVRSPNGHTSFKQETYIYLVNSSFWKQIFGASNPVPLFVSLLLSELSISQRKEFCSAAQTFLCIFLKRSLTIALAVAL